MTKTDVVIFLAGAAVGAVVGYYVGKKHTEDDYEYIVPPMEDEEEPVDKITIDSDGTLKTNDLTIGQHHAEEPTTEDFVEDVHRYHKIADKVNKYETLARTYTDSDKYIEEIAPEEFGEGVEDCMMLYRYANDIYVQEDCQIPIIDPWKILGLDVMGKLADTDIKMMYVRNHRMKCDYEIVQLDEEWEEMEE